MAPVGASDAYGVFDGSFQQYTGEATDGGLNGLAQSAISSEVSSDLAGQALAPTAGAIDAVTADPASISSAASSLFDGANELLPMASKLVALLPEPIQGGVGTLMGDVVGLATLHPTIEGVLRIGVLYYFLFARPSPLVAALDYYVLRPLSKLTGAKFSENDFTLRDRLGNGNYGQVYEGLRISKNGLPDLKTRELTPEQKQRRVVKTAQPQKDQTEQRIPPNQEYHRPPTPRPWGWIGQAMLSFIAVLLIAACRVRPR